MTIIQLHAAICRQLLTIITTRTISRDQFARESQRGSRPTSQFSEFMPDYVEGEVLSRSFGLFASMQNHRFYPIFLPWERIVHSIRSIACFREKETHAVQVLAEPRPRLLLPLRSTRAGDAQQPDRGPARPGQDSLPLRHRVRRGQGADQVPRSSSQVRPITSTRRSPEGNSW